MPALQIVLYLGEFGASVAMIVNATVVMFLAILVENSDRSWKDKDPKGYQASKQSWACMHARP